MEQVQTFGRKKQSVAVAIVRTGNGQIRVNGCPIDLVKPDVLRLKVYEPLLLLGKERYAGATAKLDIRVRVKGGGYTGQIYAIRQAIAKESWLTTKSTLTKLPRRDQRHLDVIRQVPHCR